jgi:hypothetical protein
MERFPVISLWQPWASLVACGAKTIETRSWQAPRAVVGRRIAIHAARSPLVRSMRGIPVADRAALVEPLGAAYPNALPFGAIVATALLARCVEVARVSEDGTHVETFGCEWIPVDPFGDFSPGRWLWILDRIEACRPIEERGRQGLWNAVLAPRPIA